MKIGVFDSGLGGLFTLKAIAKALPEYDYVYLGDTKRVPYGSRSHDTIYEFLKEGIDFLFAKNCALIIVACNTASAEALRRVQQEYLPKKYPGRSVLGMIVPMAEACAGYTNVGLIATTGTASSGAYPREAAKRAPGTKILSIAAPLLVPIIEAGNKKLLGPVLKDYLSAWKGKKLDAVLLGCTHYPIVKTAFRKLLPKRVALISQDTVVPKKLGIYLIKHPEISTRLSTNGTRAFYVTDVTPEMEKLAKRWFGKEITIEKVVID